MNRFVIVFSFYIFFSSLLASLLWSFVLNLPVMKLLFFLGGADLA